MSTRATVSFFTRRGDGRRRFEDALLVGPYVVARPSPPASVVIDVAHPALVAVFDGMGGRPAGHRASLVAATELGVLHDAAVGRPDLFELIVETSRRLNDLAEGHPALDGMGTTVAGVEVARTSTAFNVGDSRVYGLRPPYLSPLTIDDVAPRDDGGGGLLQCLGAGRRHVEPHVVDLEEAAEAVMLLCTDGLYRHCSTSDLEGALQGRRPIDVIYEMAQGAQDDIAAALVHVVTTTPAPYAAPAAPPLAPEVPEDVDVRTRRRRLPRWGGRPAGPPAAEPAEPA
jgi:serine/threonine protein phosphatase PrpC